MSSQISRKLASNLRSIVNFHKILGITEYPATDGLKNFLTSLDKSKSPAPAPGPTKVKTEPARSTKKPAAVLPKPAPAKTMTELKNELDNCTQCELHAGRNRVLFGQGNEKAKLFIVGDWPNAAEDQAGRLNADAAGELLDRMLAAINLSIDDVYITNVLKCFPVNDRPPRRVEIIACLPHLRQQIEIVSPKVICTMGPLAARVLLETEDTLFRIRGRFHRFALDAKRFIPLMPTFHPAFLLQNQELKKASWVDLQLIQSKLKAQR